MNKNPPGQYALDTLRMIAPDLPDSEIPKAAQAVQWVVEQMEHIQGGLKAANMFSDSVAYENEKLRARIEELERLLEEKEDQPTKRKLEPISRADALSRLRELKDDGDKEAMHVEADEILLRLLFDDEIAEAFDAIDKYYA